MQNIAGQGQQNKPPIEHTGFQQLPLRAQQRGQRAEQRHAQNRQHNAAGQGGPDQQGKNLIGLLAAALPHGFCDEGAAAGAEHEPGGPQYHQHRVDKIHRREGGLAHKVGDKEAVHDAIDGGNHQHDDGRKGEAQ